MNRELYWTNTRACPSRKILLPCEVLASKIIVAGESFPLERPNTLDDIRLVEAFAETFRLAGTPHNAVIASTFFVAAIGAAVGATSHTSAVISPAYRAPTQRALEICDHFGVVVHVAQRRRPRPLSSF
jgi:hypothetical protein